MPSIVVHKIASATRGLIENRTVTISHQVEAQVGAIVVVQALTEKSTYDTLELVGGRMAHITKGDVIAGVLGERRALKGFVGGVPASITAGDELHVLNLGGVIGRCTSAFGDIGPPLVVQVHGQALDERGAPFSIRRGAIEEADRHDGATPLVLVSGTCMSAGKTRAACEIVAHLSQRRYRVAGLKLSGVACQRDVLNMKDHGAVEALSFLDCGLPSTVGLDSLAPMARGLLNRLETLRPDLIVVEMGDGVIGEYGVGTIFDDPVFRERIRVHVLCANDLVGAFGAVEFLKQRGITIDLFSGPATDNEVGTAYIARSLGIPAHNARLHADKLGRAVEVRVFG